MITRNVMLTPAIGRKTGSWGRSQSVDLKSERYPKQQRLLNLKKASVASTSLPPAYISYPGLLSLQPCKFDVIVLDPPFSSSFTWDDLQDLPIPSLAGDPSFVFLWVGSGAGEGLERGREVLAKWGYRRCEDVVWVKTNKTSSKGPGTDPPTTSLLTRTKQHCLIGIRGTVRRSSDSWFVHCNVDTDVIFWEGDPLDPTRKPPEMYTVIENFCLGLRRLEIFGRPSSLRRGWVTVMAEGQHERLPAATDARGTIHIEGDDGGLATRWEKEAWEEAIKERSNGGKAVVPMTPEIDALRPKSPFRPGQNNANANQQGGGGASGPRFSNTGNRMGFAGPVQGQGIGQNQMMVQPMMGMGINAMGMGMGGHGVGVDEMMGAWNPMMAAAGMGGMNVGGMGNMNLGNMGRLNPGMRMGMPMMGNMGMGTGGFGAGGAMFNPGLNAGGMGPSGMNASGMGWGDPGQFNMEGGWDGDGIMVGVNGVMNNMGISGGGMAMGQWGAGAGAGTF
ncbi:hypothetical protein DXG03_005607 [Asterophora parasitica]|uniref:MT-A70-domain-containing protein n=1 Tax=Asterophora parasitica TaxID=117018 RepID=A0A9P7KF77_9AGAR|nr:hypothetical protein DXG03_005607 [Asterophora parasitica]